MHRSGTSLVSSYLEAAGLDIGDHEGKAAFDNPLGYFEDQRIVDFHKKVLRRAKSDLILPSFPISLDAGEKAFIEWFRSKEKNFGFKDPRTTLFLNDWRKLRADANFLLLFRHPFYVTQSLLARRSDRSVKRSRKAAALSWIIYNKIILDFSHHNRDRTLIFDVDDFVLHPEWYLGLINRKFRMALSKPIETPFKSDLFGTRRPRRDAWAVDKVFWLRTRPVWWRLRRIRDRPGKYILPPECGSTCEKAN